MPRIAALFLVLIATILPAGFGHGAVDLVNSSGNLIRDNRFSCNENTGPDAGLIHGNVFHENTVLTTYSGDDPPVWTLTPAGAGHPGGTGCDNEAQKRLRTYGNV